jgi:rRNA maturation protein Nop10
MREKLKCVTCAVYSLSPSACLLIGAVIKYVLIPSKKLQQAPNMQFQKYRSEVKRINGLYVSVRSSTNFITWQLFNQRQ